ANAAHGRFSEPGSGVSQGHAEAHRAPTLAAVSSRRPATMQPQRGSHHAAVAPLVLVAIGLVSACGLHGAAPKTRILWERKAPGDNPIVHGLAIDTATSTLIVASTDREVQYAHENKGCLGFWGLNDGAPTHPNMCFKDSIESLALSSDGRFVAL